MCCFRLKQSSICINSAPRGQEEESTCVLKSPRMTTFVDVEQSDMSRSFISEMKWGCGFGGLLIMSGLVVMSLGDDVYI